MRTGLQALNVRSQHARLGAVARAGIADRIETIDWNRVARDLDDRGSATIPKLLDMEECAALAGLYFWTKSRASDAPAPGDDAVVPEPSYR